jgi:tRNA (cmo5U34)-methyltransferase
MMLSEHPKTVQSRRHFERMAAQYDTLFVPRLSGYEAMHAVILALLPAPRDRQLRILELGAGTGNLTEKLLICVPNSRVVGYDLSAAMLDQARAKLASQSDRVDFVEADMSRAEFAGLFDVVVSSIAVHHVPPRSKPGVFRRLYEALQPGGALIIGDAFRAATPELDSTYRRLRAAAQSSCDPDAAAYEAFRTQAGPAGGSSTQMSHYLRWMRQAGFVSVDCAWKQFSIAVVYGERPAAR